MADLFDDLGIVPGENPGAKPQKLKPYHGEIEAFLDAPPGLKPYHGQIEAFLDAPAAPKQNPGGGGFVASAKQMAGSTIKGAGQLAADFIPGVDQDNALKRYGQSVVDANPTAVQSLGDIADRPGTAVAEAAGNAGASVAGMVGIRALGQGITALSPLAGPAAPIVAGTGQAISWGGPVLMAALPSFGGIRERQIQNDPGNENSAASKALAAGGAATVGLIESRFGPQEWALRAMSKEGRDRLAEQFAAKSLTGAIGKGMARGAAIEGAEELAQNPIEQLAAYEDPRTAENLQETAFGGAMGALGGGVFGGGFGAASRIGRQQSGAAEPAPHDMQPAYAPTADTAMPPPVIDGDALGRAGVYPPAPAPVLDTGQIDRWADMDAGQQAGMPPGAALWRNRDFDLPVEVIGPPQTDTAGRLYVPVRGTLNGVTSTSYVPAEELAGWNGSIMEEAADPLEVQRRVDELTGVARQDGRTGNPAKDMRAALGEQVEPQVVLDEEGRPKSTTSRYEVDLFHAEIESRLAKRQRNIEAGQRLQAARRPSEQMGLDPNAGPLSAAAVQAVDGGASAAMAQAQRQPVLRERDYVPSPAGSFSAMDELAGLVGEEGRDVEQRRTRIAQAQAQRRAFDLEETDRRVAEQMQREASERRRMVLDSVLEGPDTANPAGRFAAALRRYGFRDSAPTEAELATIRRFEDIHAAQEVGPEIEPSVPNELDAAAMGIRERRPKAGAGAQVKENPVSFTTTGAQVKDQAKEAANTEQEAQPLPPPRNLREGLERIRAKRQAQQAAQPAAAPRYRRSVPMNEAAARRMAARWSAEDGQSYQVSRHPENRKLFVVEPAIQQEAMAHGASPDTGTDAVVAAPRGAQAGDDVGRGAGDLAQPLDVPAVGGRESAARSAVGGGGQAVSAGVEAAGPGVGGRKAKIASRLKPDPVLAGKASTAAGELRAMAQDAGWAEEGGRLIRGADGSVSRSKWVPRAEWFHAGMEARPDVLAQHIEDVLAGRGVPVKSRRTIEGMMEWLEAQRGAATLDEDSSMYDFEAAGFDDSQPVVQKFGELVDDGIDDGFGFAEIDTEKAMRSLGFTEEEIQDELGKRQYQSGPGAARQNDAGRTKAGGKVRAHPDRTQTQAGTESREGLTLSSYTRSDLAQREAGKRAAEDNKAREQQERERRAQADAERGNFALTGSGRPADMLAAQGQTSLLDAPAGPATAEDSPAVEGSRQKRDQAMRLLMDRGDGSGSPDGLSGPEHLSTRTEIVSVLTGRPVAELEADPRHRFKTSVKEVERLLHEAAGVEGASLNERRGAFSDFVDEWLGFAPPSGFASAQGIVEQGDVDGPMFSRAGKSVRRGTFANVATDRNVAGEQQGDRAASDGSRRETDHRMEHRPAGPDVGVRMDDLTDAFSDDIYSRNAVNLHGHMIPADRPAIATIQKVRGKPDTIITIYRAVPKDAGDTIRYGDWVTITREYAKDHGEGPLDGDYKIISAKVPAGTLFNEGNSIHEFGYHPYNQNESFAPDEAGAFVAAPDGSIDFGEITPQMARAMRRQAGAIRLERGDDSYGERHIELRHGDDIRRLGFSGVPEFVADIARNISQVWQPGKTAQLVAIHELTNDRVLFVELRAARDEGGDYYTVRSAFPARKGFVKNKGWELLWEDGRAQPSTDASSSAPFAVSAKSNAGRPTTIPSGQSSDPSVANPGEDGTPGVRRSAGGRSNGRGVSRESLRSAIVARFPSLTKAVDAMLERGDRGQKGGAVLIGRADADSIASVFASKTGRGMDEAVRMFRSEGTGDIQGFYDPRSGLTFLVGPNLTTESAPAVLLHEMTHGQQRAEIDAKAMELLAKRKRIVARPAREFLHRVAARMADAGETGNAGEAAAYIVEQAVLEGRQAGFSAADGKLLDWIDRNIGRSVGNLVREFVAMVRAWGLRHGWYPRNLSVDDLVALARMGVKQAARGDVRVSDGGQRASAIRGPLLPAREEAEGYRAALEAAMSSMRSNIPPVKVMTTPPVLRVLGAQALPITISRDVVRKATNGVKHDVTMEAIRRLPEELANPVMVFDSATEPGSLVVLTGFKDGSGRPVMIAVGLNVKASKDGYEINRIASAYGRRAVEYMNFVERGLLRYRNTAKSPGWLSDNGLQLPNSLSAARGFWDSVPTEADIVNEPGIQFSRAAATASALSNHAQRLYERATGQQRTEPDDPFRVENARLREQDKTLWKKARDQLRRWLSPGGLLPQAVFDEKVRRDSEFQAVEFDVRHIVGGFERAVKQDFGADFDALPADQQRRLSDALAGKVPDGMPEAARTAVVAMRQYIDSLSGEYLKIIQSRIDALMLKADESKRDSDKAAAINEIGLYEKIRGNLGAYVHRSYRAFDDPNWFRKVPTVTLNAARRYLAEGYREGGKTGEAEALRLADVAINEILKNGTAYGSMESFIAEGKLGAKDLSVLMRRKEVPQAIRMLLGEYTDPRLNFTKSATKMGRLIWNQRFLDRVREIGVGAFLFEGKERPPGATVQIAAEGSEVYAPLNGLWTFPEVAQAFKDALGKDRMGDLYRAIVRANGMVKYGKTVLSPTTAMRNWQSAMLFTLANGHFDLGQMKKSIAAFREQVRQNASGDDLAYLRHLKQLGVVYDTPYAGEMMRYIEDARADSFLDSTMRLFGASEGAVAKGLRGVKQINQMAQGFYSFGDDFWKIIGFENEKANLLKAGLSLTEAEREAAKRIRNTYPTYSMVGAGVRWLSRFPLMGTFVSFPAEIVRTSANMLRITAADLKSGNPAIREMGVKRAVGMALVSGMFYGLAALTKAMFGVDDDEEEALRDLAPEWQKNSTFLFAGRDEKGNLRYFDLSFLDPYGYWKRPITAMLRDQPWEKSAASALRDMLEPFFGTDIATGAIFQVLSNKKETGGKVYQENAGAFEQAGDIANHLRKALQPGFVGNIERLALAARGVRREGSGQPYDLEDEMVALLGWRASTMDPKTALYYRSFEFNDAMTEARQVLTRTLRSANAVSQSDIQSARETANRRQAEAFVEMHRLVQAAKAAGMNLFQIRQVLQQSGISSANATALMRGTPPPPLVIGPQAAGRAVQQARVMHGPEFAQEVARRIRVAAMG